MPTLKTTHIANPLKAVTQAKTCRQHMSLPTLTDDRKKCDCPKIAIGNAGESADIKVIALNKLIGNSYRQ